MNYRSQMDLRDTNSSRGTGQLGMRIAAAFLFSPTRPKRQKMVVLLTRAVSAPPTMVIPKLVVTRGISMWLISPSSTGSLVIPAAQTQASRSTNAPEGRDAEQ
jgi:hypothetical protein